MLSFVSQEKKNQTQEKSILKFVSDNLFNQEESKLEGFYQYLNSYAVLMEKLSNTSTTSNDLYIVGNAYIRAVSIVLNIKYDCV